jgi:ABC-type Fe3+ transport system substrate-binding protein
VAPGLAGEAEARRFPAFLTSQKGQDMIGESVSSEYPVASGATTAQPETPFGELHPNSITIPELGTGAVAITWRQEARLL